MISREWEETKRDLGFLKYFNMSFAVTKKNVHFPSANLVASLTSFWLVVAWL
jgi:hypothetical protein